MKNSENSQKKLATLKQINLLNESRLKVYEFNGLSEVLTAGILSYFSHKTNNTVMTSDEIDIIKDSANKIQRFVKNLLCQAKK